MPGMVEKELWIHLLAYNRIRLLMAQSVQDTGVHRRQLSFKQTVQLCAEWTAHGIDLTADADTPSGLIAQSTVGNPPGRIEPRGCKRRPKSYPSLNTTK